MEVLTIIVVLIISLLVLEMSKHIFVKTFAKSVLVILIISVAFLFVIGAINSESKISTDNEIIQTGAAIVEEIKDVEIIENVLESSKEYIEDTVK